MRAIETMYAGTLFRSRLEARWAVFFDELDIKWEFEPEGFYIGLCSCWDGDSCDNNQCSNRRRYLPDFYLPDLDAWVEVKGSEDRLDRDLLCLACDYDTSLPGLRDSLGTKRGLLVLGPIPRPGMVYAHPLLQHRKGVLLSRATFEPRGYFVHSLNQWFGDGYAGADWKYGLLAPLEFEHHRNPSTDAAYSAARSARFEHSHREVWKTTATRSN